MAFVRVRGELRCNVFRRTSPELHGRLAPTLPVPLPLILTETCSCNLMRTPWLKVACYFGSIPNTIYSCFETLHSTGWRRGRTHWRTFGSCSHPSVCRHRPCHRQSYRQVTSLALTLISTGWYRELQAMSRAGEESKCPRLSLLDSLLDSANGE